MSQQTKLAALKVSDGKPRRLPLRFSSMVRDPSFRVDPADPRAPPQAVWDALTPAERRDVVASLPNEVSIEEMAPEGDPHRKAKEGPLDALRRFFERIGRKVYLSSELAVYYPDERRFVPDVLTVLDVDPHDRMKWVVGAERKGLDLVMEVHVEGDKARDHERNVERYARLGIPEYFIFDRGRLRLKAFRLRPGGRTYDPIVPQGGRYAQARGGADGVGTTATSLRTAPPEAPGHEQEQDRVVVALVARERTRLGSGGPALGFRRSSAGPPAPAPRTLAARQMYR